VLDFPLQRSLTAVLGQAAMMRGDLEFAAMWAGQGAPLIRVLPAGELVATLVRETEQVLEGWTR
jgi:nitronate monooxygenase